jgi:hypothetical protein
MPVPTIKPMTTGKVDTELLDFDADNPRLFEEGFKKPSDTQIIRALADSADLSEIVESIGANGYIDIEPLIVQRVKNRFVVLEGNRRLAAIRILLNPDLAKNTGITVPEISKAVLKTLKVVTVYAVSNPDQARNFIGFKHINGPHKWDAHAKGRFAADWYRKEKSNGITLEKIAQRLGDRHDTVVRLVNGIFVLDQATATKAFSMDDRYPGRKFAFSHLYTALTRPGYREYLGLPDEWRTVDPKPNPVPRSNIDNLQQVMTWLYGSKPDAIEPVVTSQNPHIKQLGAVLQNPRARAMLISRNSLSEAYAEVGSKGTRFESALINAKQEAETALSQIAGFDPEDSTLLEAGGELRTTADALFTTMTGLANKKTTSRK